MKSPTKNINIAYIGGGSRGLAWTFMTDLALEKQLSGEIRLYDIDHKASKINEKIGNAIKEYSPNAWVINYTNPMTLCVRTLYKVFPGIKAFGCCHEVFNTQEMLASILSNELHEKIRRQDLYTNVIGINHFTWFTRASYRDIDIFPIYENYIKKHFKEGYEFTSDN